jgi:hypothetical protein
LKFVVFFPGASVMLAELALEAGLPDGVLNIVHGTHVCHHPFSKKFCCLPVSFDILTA